MNWETERDFNWCCLRPAQSTNFATVYEWLATLQPGDIVSLCLFDYAPRLAPVVKVTPKFIFVSDFPSCSGVRKFRKNHDMMSSTEQDEIEHRAAWDRDLRKREGVFLQRWSQDPRVPTAVIAKACNVISKYLKQNPI